MNIKVTLIAPPENPPRNKTTIGGKNPLTGAVVENLSPAVAEELGLHSGAESGVIIANMKQQAIAAEVGLQVGDRIMEINQMKITTVDDVQSAVTRAARGWRLTIKRGDNVTTIMVGS